MKKLLLIAVLIAACLSATAYVACVAAPLLGKNIKGSGKIVTKTVPAPDFDGIEASMLNLPALSVVSPMIFEALEASSERIFPLAGTVIVTLPFWMLFTF